MSRPRGGSLETRQQRSVECRACGQSLRACDAGQMLNFHYLCPDCTQSGRQLESFVDPETPGRRWVRVTQPPPW